MPFALPEYRPLLRGGHLQTLYAWARRRSFPSLPPPEARLFDVAPDARVLAHCHWQTARAEHPTLILLHGLEGSSLAHYMGGMADKAWAAGWNVVRLNQRNCGGTEHLSRGLYHSGLTTDLHYVVNEVVQREGTSAVAVAGYSLGGNLALKFAGELTGLSRPEVKAVCAVSPTMDLAGCVAALERRNNYPYQWNFVRNLKARMRRKAAAFPDLYSTDPLARIWTVRAFDEAYTAPYHGFRDADDYYFQASALRVIDRISVPTLILSAADDPFVPLAPFLEAQLARNPALQIVVTDHGGHCAYLERDDQQGTAYWAERQVVGFADHHVRRLAPSEAA